MVKPLQLASHFDDIEVSQCKSATHCLPIYVQLKGLKEDQIVAGLNAMSV